MPTEKETLAALAENFPSNSKTSKTPPKSGAEIAVPTRPKAEKIVKGVVKQKRRGVGKKIADVFIEEDVKDVKGHVVHEYLIPAAKSMICDIVGWGGMAEMILFGGSRRGRTFGGGGINSKRDNGKSSYTSYSGYYRDSNRDRDRDKDRGGRDISKTGRTRHDFDEIVLESRGEAEEVLAHMVDLIVDYGQATVADFYDLVGVNSNFTDEKYGWYELRGVIPRRVRGGYLLDLPRTQLLD